MWFRRSHPARESYEMASCGPVTSYGSVMLRSPDDYNAWRSSLEAASSRPNHLEDLWPLLSGRETLTIASDQEQQKRMGAAHQLLMSTVSEELVPVIAYARTPKEGMTRLGLTMRMMALAGQRSS